MTTNSANPNPKSTVDLPLEPLMWVDKRSANAPFAVRRHSFSPIKRWQWKPANQKQNDTGQKMNPLTVDLGCATASGGFTGRGNPLWTGPLFCSSIAYMASPSKAAGNNNPANPLPFEEALKKLEGIVEAMESDDLPLETLLAKYEEGTKLVKQCRGKLSEAELKIQQLEKNADKEMKLKPFEAEETI
jgi:exodeoxyribonuclease VII small subunit